jgi:hypothetical protein
MAGVEGLNFVEMYRSVKHRQQTIAKQAALSPSHVQYMPECEDGAGSTLVINDGFG